ncbi:hypothetical protein D3P07_17030 [Paenibacillus sp. 1011MAR3C5]|uniref:hypothetical protein n=1 Tax=Paenibacillus sp. 1011MAR3C5 TaxID=1675787 RepID=UPI000E6BA03C|nr:hypothetical protein [Paenibacillus sp. 1011MAR3C5]RJE86885.1 hypothetical protein D3P07_17030 [Paenibacillus sp. 1011MAR3C5]
MKTGKFLWISILIAVLLGSFAIGPERASACSCALLGSVNEAKQNNDVVFDGTVKVKKEPVRLFSKSSADPVTWTFEVHEIWKGKVSPTIAVTSAQSSASCGYEFQEGSRYVVYARNSGESLDVSLCSRTALHSAAGQDLAELGIGSVPPQSQAGQHPGTASSLWWVLWVGIAVILVAAIIIIRHRRKRRPTSM